MKQLLIIGMICFGSMRSIHALQSPTKVKSEELMMQVLEGEFENVQRFLAEGADVNYVDREGMTPLLFAVDSGKLAIVELLLQKGAQPALGNKYGKTTLEVAKAKLERLDPDVHADKIKDAQKIIDLLEKQSQIAQEQGNAAKGTNGSSAENKMNEAAIEDAYHKLYTLLQASRLASFTKPEVEVAELEELKKLYSSAVSALFIGKKRPLLVEFVYREKYKIAQFLLQQGENIDAQDRLGRTALMVAVQNGNLLFVKELLSRKAKTSIQDDEGATALDHAQKGLNDAEGANEKKTYTEIIALLSPTTLVAVGAEARDLSFEMLLLRSSLNALHDKIQRL